MGESSLCILDNGHKGVHRDHDGNTWSDFATSAAPVGCGNCNHLFNEFKDLAAKLAAAVRENLRLELENASLRAQVGLLNKDLDSSDSLYKELRQVVDCYRDLVDGLLK